MLNDLILQLYLQVVSIRDLKNQVNELNIHYCKVSTHDFRLHRKFQAVKLTQERCLSLNDFKTNAKETRAKFNVNSL